MNNNKQSYANTFASHNVIIGVSGIIGAGKSTLSEALGQALGANIFYEPVQTNKYLAMFYTDMKKYAFPMQVFLLNRRFQQHQQIAWSGEHAIQDRTIYEDVIFAKMLYESGDMTELDFQTYRDLYSNMTRFLHRPDLIVYLDVKPEEAINRIKIRARGCEINISVDYLNSLQNGYEEWLKDISPRIPVLRLDWNEFLPTEEVIVLIKAKLDETRKGLVI